MVRRTTLRAAAGLLLSLLALPVGAAHAGNWLKPVPLNLSTGAAPSVALDANGNAVVTWQTHPGGTPAGIVVQGAHHLFGPTGFSELPDFSTDTTTGHGNGSALVVTNRLGNGLVVWVNDLGGGTQQIQMRTIVPGGAVGAIQTVPSAGALGGRSNPAAAINDNGDAVVAWQHGTAIEAITRQGLGGLFTNVTTPDQLDAASNTAPSVAIDGAGNSIVVWQAVAAIDAKRHPAGGSWTASPDSIATGGHLYTSPAIAANPSGQMVVAYLDNGTSVAATSGTVSGGWGATPAVTTLSSSSVNHGPSVNVDDTGGAAVGWSTATAVQVSLRPAGGSFPAPAGALSVSPVPVTPNSIALAGNGHGALIVSWWSFETSVMQNVVRAAVKPAGAAAFGASQIVSDPTTYSSVPVIALDQNGDGVVGFSLGATPAGTAVAVYDGAGPVLGSATGPATVKQGASAAFSVPQPTDAFSAVASVSWSFGDGATAKGTQVSHAFGRAGTFTVKVTATDAAGNASSASRTVTVTPTAPPPLRCRVPKLKGKTLGQAKTLLRRAHCALGKVSKPKPPKHRKLRQLIVSRTSPGAGAVRAAGAKVALTLAEAPKPKKHKK